MAEEDEQFYREEAIMFFKQLIQHRREKLGIDTRPVNFAGNIGRQMPKYVKKWFVNKYPNNSDYIKFFLENENHFHYNTITGDVCLNTGTNRPFVRPDRLIRLEDECTQRTTDLSQLSRNVYELEYLIVVFKTFVESLNLKKTYELKTRQLADEFCADKYQNMLKSLANSVANPVVDSRRFETDLMEYLDQNYSELFAVDKHRQTIRLQLQVIESLRKVNEALDDTIYTAFEHLLVKFLEKNGPKDVDVLLDLISQRHPFIVEHIFGQKKTTPDDYTLLDFCTFNETKYAINVSMDGLTGRTQRLIDVRKPSEDVGQSGPQINGQSIEDFSDDVYVSGEEEEGEEVYISSEEELYVSEESCASDEEVYQSDDDVNAMAIKLSTV